MATVKWSDSKGMHSWWWNSHISPKNSKWLQENLTGMDIKVKQMIKLIEEDADSFARRAEMYYKKRPELMKLAHQSMAEAFPNQVPMAFADDTQGGSAAELLSLGERSSAFSLLQRGRPSAGSRAPVPSTTAAGHRRLWPENTKFPQNIDPSDLNPNLTLVYPKKLCIFANLKKYLWYFDFNGGSYGCVGTPVMAWLPHLVGPCLGPVPRVDFGESPNCVVTHPGASTYRGAPGFWNPQWCHGNGWTRQWQSCWKLLEMQRGAAGMER
ncbi:hypothetical protein F3Y22_tig00110356pilonHSYRG00178 [Hibiscus syriacus]|uniref:NAB domain-containing protein n=1 Tax=Hibiscus syriacus TaxID=106335 RepID=A0A6A3AYK4_HIBSY|nr:hypothetical protein F3Y22_tig00110356pilonHSYRG00178 [Hibiscus syriacus]